MDILILGGTVFLGRALVDVALARGHRLTLFNRGVHSPELYPDVERLRGDRGGDLSALEGRRWDAVIDTSGYIPRAVGASATLLADAVEHYTFISSISVYADTTAPGVDEQGEVAELGDASDEEVSGANYGALKALCEQAAERAMPGRVLQVRPGLIVGPHDPTDRFSYWPARVAEGGHVLAPNQPEHPLQVIDVRDLAEWTVTMAEQRRIGVYNATAPAGAQNFGELLEVSRAVSGSDAEFTWVDEAFLLEQGVQPWVELPLWLPSADSGLMAVSVRKALDAGLTLRPLDETVRDTLAWLATRPADHSWRAGLTRTREAELLHAWQSR